MITALLALMLNGLAIADTNMVSFYDRTTPEVNAYAKEARWAGEQVLSGNAVTAQVNDMYKWDSLIWILGAVSSGDITSMTITWLNRNGKTISTSTLASGAILPNKDFKSNSALFTLSNSVGATVNVTANITLTRLMGGNVRAFEIYNLATTTSTTVSTDWVAYPIPDGTKEFHLYFAQDGNINFDATANGTQQFVKSATPSFFWNKLGAVILYYRNSTATGNITISSNGK